MALPPTLPRRRAAALAVAVIGCLSLVLLPVIGLLRVDQATERSHRYTTILSNADSLGTRILQLVTGSLATYGATPSEATYGQAVQDLHFAREQLRTLEASFDEAEDLGMSASLEAYADSARTVLDRGEAFVAEIQSGETLQTAPSRDGTVAAAATLLRSQGQFALDISPVRLELDEARREALRDGQILLGVAVVVAAITVVALLVIDTRRIQGMFATQDERRQSAERLAAHRADVVNLASHELRSPLTVLTLSTDVLRDTAQERNDPELTGLAEDAHMAALRCEALISELLDLGRIDADRLNLRMGATPLAPALQDAARLSEATHGAHPLIIKGADEVRVNADPERLRVILRNVIDNAFKYSPAGSDVQVEVEEWEGRVRIDVRDNGAGVAEADRDRIFQRFQRLSATEHLPGVGIGLYLSRELARRMDGDLRCAPSDGGARFQLELPQAG